MTTIEQATNSAADIVELQDLDSQERRLLKRAQRVALSDETAYNPSSGFFVGSAILLKSGRTLVGSNVENAAFGGSICSERCALMVAHASGVGDSVVAIAIVGRHRDGPTTKVTGPCGECRQVINEFAYRSGIGEDFKVILATTNLDVIKKSTIGRLLPLAFGPEDLQTEP